MLIWIVIVLGLQLIGELAAALSGLPIPGPVIGMVLLLALLLKMGRFPMSWIRLPRASCATSICITCPQPWASPHTWRW